MNPIVLFVGNSDGITLDNNRALLKEGLMVAGISRSESSLKDPSYWQMTVEIQHQDFRLK